MTVELLRAVVRPTVTWTLVGAQVAIAVGWATGAFVGAESAFAALAPFTMMALVFWFRARDDDRDREEREDRLHSEREEREGVLLAEPSED
jgi:hypothetical protein